MRTSQPLKKPFTQTASTMHQTFKDKSASHKRTSDLFERPVRDNIRLYSTVKCDGFPMSKFRKMNISSESLKWRNWKFSGFPIVGQSFKSNLKVKLEKQYGERSIKEPMKVQQMRIRHKIREVLKLKQDVSKAQQNNRLIKLIQNAHNNKIKAFFDELQKYLNK